MASAATLTPERLFTLEEYLPLPASNGATELVRGRVVTLNPPCPWHGYVCARAAYLLTQFVDQHQLGSVLSNASGVITGTDTLHGADVAYYSFRRVSRQDIKQHGYLSAVPEVIFEVKSPDDRSPDVLPGFAVEVKKFYE